MTDLNLTPDLALRIIAAQGCETTTDPAGCAGDNRHPLARYGAERMCDPCIATEALRRP